jgi:transcriptional regulator with GAF, ATPase, and Fis domain
VLALSDESSLTPALGLQRRAAPPAPRPQLCVLLECDRPLAPSSRHSLWGVDEVVLRRGPHRSALRSGKQLVLSIADQWLSGTHARLVREEAGFVLRDAGSTNGTWVDGRPPPVEGLLLRDGELIEIGHTLLLFRAAALQRPVSDPADLDGGQLDPGHTGLVTLSSSLQAEHERLAAIARSNVSVVIGGETGAGKEVVARALHALSGREGPFVAVNCGAIPRALVESELFGHRKGAFSGATEDRPGLFRSADQGTLLLDEIGDLPLEAQAALLRVLQEGEVLPVGATRPAKVDVRVLAATHRDLAALVHGGQFRADLLSRIAGFTVRLPPLRERPEDLGLLVAALLKKVAGDAAAHVQLTCEAGRALARYRWPLNVRELEQCLRAALVLAGMHPIDVVHLPEAVRAALREGPLALEAPPPVLDRADATDPQLPAFAAGAADAGQAEDAPPARPLRPLTAEEERHKEELLLLVRDHKGNVTTMARALNKARMQVQRWLKRYGIDPGEYRRG